MATSAFVVADKRLNKAAHASSLGGGRIAAIPGGIVGDFRTQHEATPMNYQVYKLAGTINAADLAASDLGATDAGRVYLDTSGVADLGYLEGVSIISAFARVAVLTAGAGTIELCADYVYDGATQYVLLSFGNAFIQSAANTVGYMGGAITLGTGTGPALSTDTVADLTAGKAQPRLFFRRNGVITNSVIRFEVYLTAIPAARAT